MALNTIFILIEKAILISITDNELKSLFLIRNVIL